MITTKPVRYQPMTADEVLAELRLFLRGWDFSDADLRKYVSPKSSLLELGQYAYSETDWGDLISSHGLSLPDDEWFAGVSSKHTVRDFCEAVAVVNEVPVLEPATVLGTPCETAGAFLTLKRMLADAGADVTALAPSSDVLPYLREQSDVFNRFRLATAGRLPMFSATAPLSCLIGSFMVVVGAVLIGSFGVQWLVLFALGAAVAGFGLLRPQNYPCLAQGQLTTFRDLIHAALGRPRRAA